MYDDYGYFTTVEGVDGAGTTSVVEALAKEYPDALITKEPTDRRTGHTLRASLSDDDVEPMTDLFLFLADRNEHSEKDIRPALDDGRMVISDRFHDSTVAYQAAAISQKNPPGHSGPGDAMHRVKKLTPGTFPRPDLTLLLDVDVQTAIERGGSEEKYENEQTLEAVRDVYRSLWQENDRIVMIDADNELEQVIDAAKAVVDANVSEQSVRERDDVRYTDWS